MNIATAIGASYLATRIGVVNAVANAERAKAQELGVGMADSFVSGYTSMALIAGIMAAPVTSSIVGAGLMVRDAYVHRAQIASTYAKANAWLKARREKKQSATVHQLRAAS